LAETRLALHLALTVRRLLTLNAPAETVSHAVAAPDLTGA